MNPRKASHTDSCVIKAYTDAILNGTQVVRPRPNTALSEGNKSRRGATVINGGPP
jgi:hypothetical protein